MASFMDYYEDELKKAGSAASRPVKKPSGVSLSSLNSEIQKKDEGGPMSAVNWVMDMLSRPLYGVQNVIEDKIETSGAAAKKIATGDPVGGAGDFLASMFKAPGGEIAEGLFSNEKKDKVSTSKNIEKFADTANQINPDYEDTEDNVNPITKGILGFVGDVALDPLTYVPGGVLLAGAKGTLKGADAALSAASKSIAGKKAAQPVEEILAAAPKVKKGKKSEGLDEENP